ncbi:hypothetical protein SAMN04487950_3018 [Halogranum rubrum]|uniref:Uncharacterized protein n=2 Tax=Halogranum rubrum TaxID=553466 RepID=A0A1I4G5F5_9EURY|nr:MULTISPECIES: hypothetical protein [Halogranum]EJN59550.1 hypothetical protein HSB1_17080 [Halogranum salarium B-1]SFL24507.1 hypothetical protein SAMN04487950_3018 [Halogranum rubrum]
MEGETNGRRGRYETLVCDDGFVEMYDTRNEFAWLRADNAVPLDRVR